MPFCDASWDLNASRIQFLRTELELANTFLDVSETTGLDERRQQNEQFARVAYRSVLRFLPGTLLSPKERRDIDQQLRKLQDRFTSAGIEL